MIKDFEGCKECGAAALDYVADLAAPGVGSTWECPECEARYHKRGRYFTLMSDVEPDQLTIDEFVDCGLEMKRTPKPY